MKSSVLFVFASALAVGGMQARAEDAPSRVLAAYGLLGSWSAACGQPPGPRNPRFHFEPRPDGLIDNVGDYGADGPSRSTILEASIDRDHRLHTTSLTRFADLPKPMREAVEQSGTTPDVTNRSIFTMSPDGRFDMVDSVVEMAGATSAMHVVSDGFIVNQKTRQPGPKAPSRFRCPE